MQIQSPQIVTNLTVSGSFSLTAEATGSLVNQITGSLNTLYVVTGSVTTADWNTLVNKPAGIVSGSSQVSYTGITNVPSGIVSGSSQIALSEITGTTFASSEFTFPSNVIISGSAIIQRGREKTLVSATAATGSINFNVLTQSVVYYTSDATANWTLNVRGDSSTTLNNSMNTGETLSVVFMATNGATAYRQTGFQIDGSNVTPKWLGGSAPSAGSINSVDSYTVSIVKTANATFTAFESFAKYT